MANKDSLFLQTIDDLTLSLNHFGLSLPRRPQDLSQVLPQIPTEAKDQIRAALDGYMQIIRTPTQGETEHERALGHFEIFRRVAGIKLADPDFMKNFNEGDICEAYSATHQQIFRTLEFFKSCSYDLFTLTIVPWNQLFSRPENVKSLMLNWAEKIVKEGLRSVTQPVPDHIIQECYAHHKKSFLYSTKHAGCLIDALTNEPKGYVTIIRVQELDESTAPGMIN